MRSIVAVIRSCGRRSTHLHRTSQLVRLLEDHIQQLPQNLR